MKMALTQEKIEISKNLYVREEIVIEKKLVTEIRQVSEETSSEKWDPNNIKWWPAILILLSLLTA